MSMIDPTSIEKALDALKRARQQAIVFRFITENPHSYTHVISRESGCINIPDCSKHIQEKIDPFGLVIAHYLPSSRPMTRHGTILATHRWLILNQSYFEAINEKPHQSGQLTGPKLKLICEENSKRNIIPIKASRKQSRDLKGEADE
tara:strand:- start:7 stop:447 length:441 start_codon:yes stop_codon:yes gene_type:complete